MRVLGVVLALWGLVGGAAMAGDNRIDATRPDAPVLAARGPLEVGVTTMTLVNTDQPDVLGAPGARGDRPLTVEIWYPATGVPAGGTAYENVAMANSAETITLYGSAGREAAPDRSGAPYPLVIISHGYPGNRFLLSHLGENLASKGYVVASIDHFQSTYENKLEFASTLANRSPDQLFVLDQMAGLSAGTTSPLAGLVDADRSAIIGYSMGGYGTLISAGAGLAAGAGTGMAPAGALDGLMATNPDFASPRDPRLKAAIAVAPWGRHTGFWDEAGLAGIAIPLLLVAGSEDEISDYENGIRAIFEEAVKSERALLTFQGAGHNAAAPIPPPVEALAAPGGSGSPFEHYADFTWDSVRMNGVLQHFVTAFLGLHLKGDESMRPYLALTADDWQQLAGDRTWPGFGPRTTRGLVFETRTP